MLRLRNLANKYQKRLVRPLYANTQATPYAAHLDPAFRGADGSLDLTSIESPAYTTFKLKGSLVPGTVVYRTEGTEGVKPCTGATDGSEKPFGLLCNFVGGDLDEGFSGDSLQNEVGVWRGPDSVFEVLAPAFLDTELVSGTTVTLQGAIDDATGGKEVLLYPGANGLLSPNSAGGDRQAVARLIEKVDSSRIIVDLIV